MMSTRSRSLIVFAFCFVLASAVSRAQGGRPGEEDTRNEPLKDTRDRPLPSGEHDSSSSTQLAGPGLGMIFDQVRGGLRPILGLPGAAIIGGVVELGLELTQSWISPRHEYALGRLKDDPGLV